MYQWAPYSVGWHKVVVLAEYTVRSVHFEGSQLSGRGSGVCVSLFNPEQTGFLRKLKQEKYNLSTNSVSEGSTQISGCL